MFLAVMIRRLPILGSLKRDSRAVTALEYAILAAVLGLVFATVFSNFREKLSMLFAPIDDLPRRLPTIQPPR
jgi:Flp pilus assembly pilin Flp